jgi:hypothetical protein
MPTQNRLTMSTSRSIRFAMHAILSVFCCVAISCNPFARQPKLDEIQSIWKKLPLYPGLVEVDQSSASGFDKAYVSKSFTSSANYDDVKRFYLEHLTSEGWKLFRERELKEWGQNLGGRQIEFRRDEYDLTIEYAPNSANHGWNYGISVSWLLISDRGTER